MKKKYRINIQTVKRNLLVLSIIIIGFIMYILIDRNNTFTITNMDFMNQKVYLTNGLGIDIVIDNETVVLDDNDYSNIIASYHIGDEFIYIMDDTVLEHKK